MTVTLARRAALALCLSLSVATEEECQLTLEKGKVTGLLGPGLQKDHEPHMASKGIDAGVCQMRWNKVS